MALHFKNENIAVPEIYDACIFTRSYQDFAALGRQGFKINLRTFLGAVFRPHRRKYAEFEIVRPAPQQFGDFFVFARR